MAWCKCNTPCLRSLIFLWVAASQVRIWKHAFHFPLFEPDLRGVLVWSTLYCEGENVFCKILKHKTTRKNRSNRSNNCSITKKQKSNNKKALLHQPVYMCSVQNMRILYCSVEHVYKEYHNEREEIVATQSVHAFTAQCEIWNAYCSLPVEHMDQEFHNERSPTEILLQS